MDNQELLEQAMYMKQQSEDVEAQLNFVDEQIKEMTQFTEKLRLLKDSTEPEFLTSIGRGVYVKAERNQKEKLFVEAGAGVVVKKTPEEISEIISDQIKKFIEAKIQLTAQLEAYATQFRDLLGEVEKMRKG